jgi:hypothetical protein
MYDPDGYRPVSFFVELLAIWGEQGKLPRRLGFVHPGDAARPDDLPAKVTACSVLGELLAAGAIPAAAILDPSGLRFPVPAHYWSSSSARATMQTDKLDLAALGFDPDLHLAYVYLATDKVVAAVGIRLAPPNEAAAPASKSPETRPGAPRGRSFRKDDEPLIAEMHARIMAGSDTTARSAARAVVHKATGNSSDDSKVERLANLYRQTYRGLE